MNFLNIVVNKPTFYLEDYVWTIYGVPGAGKTTTALNMVAMNYGGGYETALLLAFDKGYKTMKGVHAQPVNEWDLFLKQVDEIVKNKDSLPYKVIIFDTISKAYNMAEKYVLREESKRVRKRLTKMSDVPYGGAYTMLDDEIKNVVEKLQNAGFGIVFIDHDNHMEETTREGDKYTLITSSLSNRGRRYIFGLSDVIMFLDYSRHKDDEGNLYSERKLHLGNDNTLAETKNRFKNMPATMPLDPQMFLDEVRKSVEAEYDTDDSYEEAQQERLDSKETELTEVVEDVSDGRSHGEILEEIQVKMKSLDASGKKDVIEKIKSEYNSTKLKDFSVEQLEDVLSMF